MKVGALERFNQRGWQQLRASDPQLYDLLDKEHRRQTEVLALIASASVVSPAALVCEATIGLNVTAEGYPGERFHAGCIHIDEIEQLAVERAKLAFKARYANVQPHSASTANQVIMFSFLDPGDVILGLDLKSGGHLTHGSKVAISGRCFRAISYGLTEDGLIDYDQIHTLALAHKPKLIICGATAYSRVIDFELFRKIADAVGAYLLADITHIAGLVATGLHPSPIDHAHFTTTCTHKQLYGPRGGLILMGRDYDQAGGDGKTLSEVVQRGVFPLLQGAPVPNSIAAKAFALGCLSSPEFQRLAARIVGCSRGLAREFIRLGYRVVGGGSDNHIVLIDLRDLGISGLVAQKALEECYIIVNKNPVPGDRRAATISSGIRLGTNVLAARCIDEASTTECARLVGQVISGTKAWSDTHYALDPKVRATVRAGVRGLCQRFPVVSYV